MLDLPITSKTSCLLLGPRLTDHIQNVLSSVGPEQSIAPAAAINKCFIKQSTPGRTPPPLPVSFSSSETKAENVSNLYIWGRIIVSRHGCDSESNHESTQNQSLFAWVMSWFDSKMGKHFVSWSNLNRYLGNPLESLVNSDSIPVKSLESWVESIQVFEILLQSWAVSNQGTWSRMPKKVKAKFSENPKKVNKTEWKLKKCQRN